MLDTGSTCHIRYSDKGMSDLVEVNDTVEVGDGDGVIITHRGTFQGSMKLDDGTFQKIKLKNCALAPSLDYNLFSMHLALTAGFDISKSRKRLILKQGTTTLPFTTIKKRDLHT